MLSMQEIQRMHNHGIFYPIYLPFFLKHGGGVLNNNNGRTLLNKTWDEMPVYALS